MALETKVKSPSSAPYRSLRQPPRGNGDPYPFLMKLVIATAVIGLAISYKKLYLLHFAMLLAGAWTVVYPSPGSLRDPTRPYSSYHWFFAFFFGWFALSITWSIDRIQSVLYVIYILIGSGVSLLIIKYVRNDLRHFESLVRVARIWFCVDLLVGLLESLKFMRLPVSKYSIYGDWEDTAMTLAAYQAESLATRPTAFHWNPNNYSAAMLMLLPFFLLHRRFSVMLVGTVLIGQQLLFAGSRASLIGYVIVVCASIFFNARPSRILGLIIVGTFAVLLLQFVPQRSLGPLVAQKIDEVRSTVNAVVQLMESGKDTDDSVGVRRQLQETGLRAFRNSYGLGIGGGADRYYQEQHASGKAATIKTMHNFWLELLVDGGVVIVSVLVAWYFLLAYELFRMSRKFPSSSVPAYYSGSLALSLLGFAPAAVSLSSSIYFLPMYIMFGFAIAIVNVCRRLIGSHEQNGALIGNNAAVN